MFRFALTCCRAWPRCARFAVRRCRLSAPSAAVYFSDSSLRSVNRGAGARLRFVFQTQITRTRRVSARQNARLPTTCQWKRVARELNIAYDFQAGLTHATSTFRTNSHNCVRPQRGARRNHFSFCLLINRKKPSAHSKVIHLEYIVNLR